jgi:hypothetical protein
MNDIVGIAFRPINYVKSSKILKNNVFLIIFYLFIYLLFLILF